MSERIEEILFIGGEHDGKWISIPLNQEVPNNRSSTYSGPIKSAADAALSNAQYLRHDLPKGWPLEVVFVLRGVNLTRELIEKYLPRK